MAAGGASGVAWAVTRKNQMDNLFYILDINW